MQLKDANYPKDLAEERLGVGPGDMSLDELACRMSQLIDDGWPVSVRSSNTKPILYSSVFLRGVLQPGVSCHAGNSRVIHKGKRTNGSEPA